ncbi:MAG: hypothetical protein WC477_02740 [Patescibacteria group bacterium]
MYIHTLTIFQAIVIFAWISLLPWLVYSLRLVSQTQNELSVYRQLPGADDMQEQERILLDHQRDNKSSIRVALIYIAATILMAFPVLNFSKMSQVVLLSLGAILICLKYVYIFLQRKIREEITSSVEIRVKIACLQSKNSA